MTTPVAEHYTRLISAHHQTSTRGTDNASGKLLEEHRRMLVEGSGIDPAVVAERGARTVERISELPAEFKGRQRRRGLLLPTFSPDGRRSYSLRPGKPIEPGRKYEQPAGVGCILDVHPRNAERVHDPAEPLWITEGVKKADSMTSRGLCALALAGVWNWQRGGELLPDWESVPLSGRAVYVAFDSDAWRNPHVQLAAERFAGRLSGRGAEVRIVYLPDAPDGSKQGVDDLFVAGGTVEDLRRLARPFEPEDVLRERLSRSSSLRLRIEELRGIHRGMPAKTMGENSRRSAMRALIDQAERYGKPVPDGVRVGQLSTRTGAEMAAMGQRTFSRAIAALEEEGRISRDDRERKAEHAASYVLIASGAPGRALVTHNGGEGGDGRVPGLPGDAPSLCEPVARAPGIPDTCAGTLAGEPPLRALPELRWSAVVSVREIDGFGRLVEKWEYLSRLGKKRAAVVEHLLWAGRSSTVPALMERFAGENARPRDFKRRTLGMLAGDDGGPAVVVIEGDDISLSPGWAEALERARELGKEQAAADQQRVNHELQRAGFRNRHQVQPPDHHPANVGADGWIEDLEPLTAAEAVEEDPPAPEEPAVSPLAAAVRDYLDSNPHDACQAPYWIGATLWAFDLFPGKPTPAEVREALDQLGGESYLREMLALAR